MDGPAPRPKSPALLFVAAAVAVICVIIAKGKMFHGSGIGGGTFLGFIVGCIAVAAYLWALYYMKKK